jgi:antitoxin CptB
MNATLKQLRWRCRRGMRELDVLLSSYLDGAGPAMNVAELAQFTALLEVEDDALWRWFMGHEPPSPEFESLVGRIGSTLRH